HFGQKGRAGSTGVWQYRQGVFTDEVPPGFASTLAETRVAGTSPGPAPATLGTGMRRAPLATTGLPQSRQNFEARSLSRPQKEQRITGRVVGEVPNIRVRGEDGRRMADDGWRMMGDG